MLEDGLNWRSHVRFIAKKGAQRLYILRRILAFESSEEFKVLYNGILLSLLKYACPNFVGLGDRHSKSLRRIQNLCMKIWESDLTVIDLALRRRYLVLRLFEYF